MDVNVELIKEIKRLVEDPHAKALLRDFTDPTKYNPEYEKVWSLFKQSKYQIKFEREWKLSQLVRAITDEDEAPRKYMYERLWSLLLEYRYSPNDYFEIETEDCN